MDDLARRAAREKHRLDPLLSPRSIALVGASQRPASNGNELVRMAKLGGFAGAIYPVNPRYDAVEGLRCYPGLNDLPETVDHVVLAVPNARLEAAFHDVVEHGARATTIFANCFLPQDTQPALADRLVREAKRAGILISGGNGMGFVNAHARLHVAGYAYNADAMTPGGVTWIAQSGSLFGALTYNDRRLRFNLCVSAGAELLVRSSDYMDWALAQPQTRVIGLFLESIRDPQGFVSALEIAAKKSIPVVILKAGRTPASAAMARTHTGAMAGDDAAYRALFARYGVIQVQTVDEMASTLLLLSQPKSLGAGKLAAIHDSGGEAEMLMDIADDAQVPLAQISTETTATLAAHLDPGLEPGNPLDAWGTGRNAVDIFHTCFRALMDDPDTALGAAVSNLRTGHWHSQTMMEMTRRVAAETAKPVVFINNYSQLDGAGLDKVLTDEGIPVLYGMESALQAVRHVLNYRDFLDTATPAQKNDVALDVSRWRQALREQGVLSESEGLDLLADYGVPVAASRSVTDVDAALAAADAIGYPVVLKTAEGIEHKSDAGGVKLHLEDAQALAAAYDDLNTRLGPKVLVAAEVDSGVEIALGAVNDPQFGPYIMVAAGGVMTELLQDNVVALAPVDARQALGMLKSLRAYRLLQGFRGQPAVDLDALAGTIVNFSKLVYDLRDAVGQVDVNPLIATSDACTAVDALVVGK